MSTHSDSYNLLFDRAAQQFAAGNYKVAAQLWEWTLFHAQHMGIYEESVTRYNLALCSSNLGQHRQSVATTEAVLCVLEVYDANHKLTALARKHLAEERVRARREEACQLCEQAHASFDRGDWNKAQALFEQALPLKRDLDESWAAGVLLNIALCHYHSRRYQQALAAITEGAVYIDRGVWSDNEDDCEKFRYNQRRMRDKAVSGEAQRLLSVCQGHIDLGEWEEGEQAAWATMRELESIPLIGRDCSMAAVVLHKIAFCRSQRDDMEGARQFWRQAQQVAVEWQDEDPELIQLIDRNLENSNQDSN